MEYQQRPNDTSGTVTTGLRERFPVSANDDGERTFEVPESLDAAAHERLISAGHTPLEPESLPSGVTYNEGDSEASESGSSSGSGEGPTDGASESEPAESDSGSGEDAAESYDPADPPEPLGEMNRSELYQYGNEELELELEWSGEGALNESEMRERIKEELGNDGE
jgi:hypothetical protein